MIYPATTFAGQKVSICNRYLELFRQEANAHQSGIEASNLRTELNAIMPEEYHSHRLVWLDTVWTDVLNGSASMGLPGIPLNERAAVTAKKDETLQALNTFYKYQREESHATIKSLLHERDKAMAECRSDEVHSPSASSFIRADGKLVLDVPSKNPRNEATNTAFAIRALHLNPDMDDEHRRAVYEAISQGKIDATNSSFWDSKIDKELVRKNINLPEPPDPYENFTGYVEDDPLGKITVAPNTITGVAISRNEDARVWKDRGAGFFNGDFTHYVTVNYDDNNIGVAIHWGLSNDVDDIRGLNVAGKSHLYGQHSNVGFYFLVEVIAGSVEADIISTLTDGQTYYYTYDRDESVGANGQLSSFVHTDPDRLNLHAALGLALRAKLDLRYNFALNSYDDNESARFCTVTVSNMDLGLIVAAGRRRRMLTR